MRRSLMTAVALLAAATVLPACRHAVHDGPPGGGPVVSSGGTGAPSSPLDLALSATLFADDRTSRLTATAGTRSGYEMGRYRARIEIRLPEGLQVVQGDPVWNGELVGGQRAELTIVLKAVRDGEWAIEATASSGDFPGYELASDTKLLFVLVKDGEATLGDRPFTRSGAVTGG